MTKRSRELSAPRIPLNSVCLFGVLFSCNSFATLVAYRATRFASRLTGASAFSATRNLSFGGFSNSLNHNFIRSLKFSFFNYMIRAVKNQAIYAFFLILTAITPQIAPAAAPMAISTRNSQLNESESEISPYKRNVKTTEITP